MPERTDLQVKLQLLTPVPFTTWRNIMKRKLLMLAAAAALAAAMLSGCSGSSTADTAAQTTAVEAENTEANTEAAEAEEASEETSASDSSDAETEVTVRVGAMSGPTAMGMVKLMSDSESGTTANTYEFADLSTDAQAMVTPIAQGELDIAAVPANLASVLYSKTNGGVKVLAVNTLGVLNLLEKGDTISGIKDLAGHKLYATGQSAVPEYVIRYLLSSNGIDPDKDVEIQWCSDTTEALSYLKEEDGAIAVLPQPFAAAAMAQIEGLRLVEDLNDAWDELDTGSRITTGVIVARTEFADEHPEAVEKFLSEYADSVAYTESNVSDSAALIEKYGIVAKAAIAEKALPKCHIVCLTGDEMKTALSGFLTVLYNQNPAAVGGALPGDDFYY